MGYTTEFYGSFKLDRPLDPKLKEYLIKFSESRRMKRKLPSKYGIDGEFYVGHSDNFAGRLDKDPTVINHNAPPSTQPSLWCHWRPNEDGTCIEWDGGEKFYGYEDWLVYIIQNFISPYMYTLNGEVQFQGEDSNDFGKIIVRDNIVYLSKGKKIFTPELVYISDLARNQVDNQLGFAAEKHLLLGAPDQLKEYIDGTEE